MAHGDEGLHDYRRELDLDTGIASVSYERSWCYLPPGYLHIGSAAVAKSEVGYEPISITYQREVFASHPDGYLVMRITCSLPGGLGLRVLLDGDEQPFVTAMSQPGTTICMDVQAREHFHTDGQCGVDGHARLAVVAEGGAAATYGAQLVVAGSDAITLLLAFESSFGGADPAAACRDGLPAAAAIPMQN